MLGGTGKRSSVRGSTAPPPSTSWGAGGSPPPSPGAEKVAMHAIVELGNKHFKKEHWAEIFKAINKPYKPDKPYSLEELQPCLGASQPPPDVDFKMLEVIV